LNPLLKQRHLLIRKHIDFIIWQEILRKIENKEHLNLEGVSDIKELRSLQYYHRRLIDSTIIDQVLSIRPHWKDRFNNSYDS
jgi:hypothetical protein